MQLESDEFHKTLDALLSRVKGQDQATKKLAAVLTSQQNEDNNQVFLFVGPSGVGKTELAKATAVSKADRFARFDMNLYTNEMSTSTIFGSGVGYHGSTDKPLFVKEMDKFKPEESEPVDGEDAPDTRCYIVRNVVVLFDEFEKAHPTIKQTLLTIFDEGYCKFVYSSVFSNIPLKYTFKSSVIIGTSNLYQAEILACFCQRMPIRDISELFVKMNSLQPLPTSYSQELLRRMEIIPFGPISRGECYQAIIGKVLDEFLEELKKALKCRELEVTNRPLILSTIESNLYGEGTDIRRIHRYFQTVKDKFYEVKASLGPMHSKKIVFNCDDNGLFVKIFTFIDPLGYVETKVPVIRLPKN